jgi:hypothetical protein
MISKLDVGGSHTGNTWVSVEQIKALLPHIALPLWNSFGSK